MQADSIKLWFTYITAQIVIVGGGAMLYFTEDNDLRLVVAGFIGAAITFVFNRESATQATRAAQSASASGAAQANTAAGIVP
jgi:class 3 adenylate cyclase